MAIRFARLGYQVFKTVYRYYREILGGAAFLMFLLGWYGFAIAAAPPGTPNGFFDTAYYALQLFGLEWGPGNAVAVDNLPLFVARFAAPVVTALSIIAIALKHLVNRYLLAFYLKRFATDHVVVFGLGYVGPEVAMELAEKDPKDRTVIVVEKDADNPLVETCRDRGVFVLIDDAAQESVLRQVQVQRASEVFIVTGDDARNIGIAYRIRDICAAGRTHSHPLRVHCHIGDAELCSNLRGRTLVAAGDSPAIIEPFNIYQVAGYCLTRADTVFERVVAGPDPAGRQGCGAAPMATAGSAPATHPDLHILIIGIGRMGEALLVRLVRRWRELNSGSRLRLTVVDREAAARQRALEAKYPALKSYADVTWLPIAVDHADALLGDETLRSSLPSVTHTYFCIDNPSLGLATALTLTSRTAPGSITRIRSLRRSEISPLVEQFSATLAECRQIREFHITSDRCCMSIVLRGMSELMARLNHDAYLANQRRVHGQDVQRPSVVPWETLSPEKQDSNREQAFDLGNKLKGIGYTVAPLTDWDEPLVDFEQMSIGETTALEAMAEWEHERWMREKEQNGWMYADIPEQDVEKKRHPDLKAYKDLTEAVKGYDRAYIRSIPKTLCRMDLKLVPADPGGSPCGSDKAAEMD